MQSTGTTAEFIFVTNFGKFWDFFHLEKIEPKSKFVEKNDKYEVWYHLVPPQGYEEVLNGNVLKIANKYCVSNKISIRSSANQSQSDKI